MEHLGGIQQDPHHFGTLTGWPSRMNSELEDNTATYPQFRSGSKGSPCPLILLVLHRPQASNLPGLRHKSKRLMQSHQPPSAVPSTARGWHHRRLQSTSLLPQSLGQSSSVLWRLPAITCSPHRWRTVFFLKGLNKTKLHFKKNIKKPLGRNPNSYRLSTS